MQELAHKKLIQEPAYVIEQWANMLSTAISHLDDISLVYENLQPTVRKVLRALSFPENMNTQQREIQRYFLDSALVLIFFWEKLSSLTSHRFRASNDVLLHTLVVVYWNCRFSMTVILISDPKLTKS